MGAHRAAEAARQPLARKSHRRLIVALDYDRLGPAYEMAQEIASSVGMFKIGSRLFTAEGPQAIHKIANLGKPVFLDLKFHDIPNTVAGAIAAAAKLPGVHLLDVHSLGGLDMMRAAKAALKGKSRPRLLGITILTSMDAPALRRVGLAGRPVVGALRLAKLARQAGLDGVVASANEVRAIRRRCGGRFLIVVPGIRPGTAPAQDQARTATPKEAIHNGADYLVVGRPITGAANPGEAAEGIAREIDQALGLHQSQQLVSERA